MSTALCYVHWAQCAVLTTSFVMRRDRVIRKRHPCKWVSACLTEKSIESIFPIYKYFYFIVEVTSKRSYKMIGCFVRVINVIFNMKSMDGRWSNPKSVCDTRVHAYVLASLDANFLPCKQWFLNEFAIVRCFRLDRTHNHKYIRKKEKENVWNIIVCDSIQWPRKLSSASHALLAEKSIWSLIAIYLLNGTERALALHTPKDVCADVSSNQHTDAIRFVHTNSSNKLSN